MRSARLAACAVAAAAAAFCLAAAMLPAAASAAPGVVTTSADGLLDGTLRHEINGANPGETVTFDPGVNPILTSPIAIDQTITLDGRGSGQTTITGPTSDRVFDVGTTFVGAQTFTISDLTITGGHAPDGLSGGHPGQEGGAIRQTAMNLVISRVEFVGNVAGDGGAGSIGRSDGGTGDRGGQGGSGGAILSIPGTNGTTLAISDSSFRDNFAGSGGNGGSGGTNTFGIGGTGGQGGDGGVGGAIASYVPTSITDTTFSNNQAGGGGAGGAGGVGQTSANGGQGGQGGHGGNGGGVETTASSATSVSMVNSTLTANHAGAGGAGGSSRLGRGAGGEGGSGGGLDGNANIRSSTIAANSAGSGGSIGGSNGTGGGINGLGTLTLVSTIVASNVAGSTTSATANCGGPAPPTVTFGLTFPAGTGCPGAVADPLLGLLASNGGPTQTMALSAGSPAIDQGASFGETFDQRGLTRTADFSGIANAAGGDSADIGAFEFQLVCDGQRAPNETCPNEAPVCVADSNSVNEDNALSDSVGCTDAEGDTLTYSITQAPAHGSFNGTFNGSTGGFTYTPAPDYNGLDSFKFKASDGTMDSSEATYSITVSPVDDPPSSTGTGDDGTTTATGPTGQRGAALKKCKKKLPGKAKAKKRKKCKKKANLLPV